MHNSTALVINRLLIFQMNMIYLQSKIIPIANEQDVVHAMWSDWYWNKYNVNDKYKACSNVNPYAAVG